MIRAVFFDFYGTLADWPTAEALQQAAAAAEGITIEQAPIAAAYRTANAYMDEENAKRPVQQRTQQERDAFFAEYERRLLADAGAPDVSPDVAARIWQRVRGAPEELTLFPDAKAALAELRALGLTLGVISNMGLELDGLLERLGIGAYLAVRSTTGSAGVSKPAPAHLPFRARAGGRAGCRGRTHRRQHPGGRGRCPRRGDHARVRAAYAGDTPAGRRTGRGIAGEATGSSGARPIAAGQRGLT